MVKGSLRNDMLYKSATQLKLNSDNIAWHKNKATLFSMTLCFVSPYKMIMIF